LRRRGIHDPDISHIDQALALALDLLNEQLHGQLRPLSSDEQTKLQWLLRLSYQYNLASRNQPHFPPWLAKAQVWKNGGGYVMFSHVKGAEEQYQPFVDETAFLGIGVAVPEPQIPDHVVLIDTDICQTQGCLIEAGAHVISTRIHIGTTEQGIMISQHPARIGARAHLENVRATNVTRFDVKADASLTDFQMTDGQINIWEKAQIHNVDIHYSPAPHPAEGLALKPLFSLIMGPNSRLQNITLSAGTPLKLYPNTGFGFASGRPAFWLVRGSQGIFQKSENIGFTLAPDTKIDLTEFAKICQNQDGISRVEIFNETVHSSQDLRRFCMQKPPTDQLNY
jgi:hypothetical protein